MYLDEGMLCSHDSGMRLGIEVGPKQLKAYLFFDFFSRPHHVYTSRNDDKGVIDLSLDSARSAIKSVYSTLVDRFGTDLRSDDY